MWLRARRDAWVDHVLGSLVAPLVLVLTATLLSLPAPVLTGVAGLAAGWSLANIKKTNCQKLVNQ